jgi:hypothetical protein
MKPRDHSRGYIDPECKPWSASGKTLLLIDHDYVHETVIDLEDFHSSLY